jgi:YcaO-like protein with predicted kinase domain
MFTSLTLRGQVFREQAALEPLGGSCRSCPPAETIRRLEPHLLEFGITRVANITGLDRIGIPVWLAVRPNSRSLSLAQGKGLTHDCAKASAICETVETFYAERCANPVRIARYHTLRREAAVADVDKLPRVRRGLFHEQESIPWVESSDLLSEETVWVPYELVHADATVPRHPGSGCFVFSSNGLASGNTRGEAVLHGLCELIERDAMALWKQKDDADQERTRVSNASVDDAACLDLIGRLDDADIDVLIWDVTSDVGVAAFRVLIFDRWSHSQLAALPVAFGAGCHPERGVALVRAITEAAQTRLTSISGSRDDLTRNQYAETAMSPEMAAEYAVLARAEGRRGLSSVPTRPCASIGAGVDALLEQLRSVGVERVCAIPLSPDGAPLDVVRTIAVGLEGPSSSSSWMPGARARRMWN